MGPKKGTQLFSDPRGGTFSTCPSLGTRLTRTQAPARSNAPAAAAIIGRCSAAVQSPRRIAVSIACESFGATQPQVDEAVVLDGEQRRDSRRLDEAPSARGDAGTRRDPLLGQHHRRLEGMLWAGGYAFVCTLILGLLIDKTIGFTVGKEVESHELDIAEHGESAYHLP